MSEIKYLTSELLDVGKIEKAAKDLLLGQEIERKRISMELHDGVITKLSQIRLKLSKLIDKDKLAHEYFLLMKELSEVNENIRRLSHSLHPFEVHNRTLKELIDDAIFESSLTYPSIKIQLNYEEINSNVETEAKKHLYYIMLELLHNALKHSFAENIIIRVVLTSSDCKLMVIDDGIGYNPKNASQGIGLHNIKARVGLLNGKFEVKHSENKGMTHEISFSI